MHWPGVPSHVQRVWQSYVFATGRKRFLHTADLPPGTWSTPSFPFLQRPSLAAQFALRGSNWHDTFLLKSIWYHLVLILTWVTHLCCNILLFLHNFLTFMLLNKTSKQDPPTKILIDQDPQSAPHQNDTGKMSCGINCMLRMLSECATCNFLRNKTR